MNMPNERMPEERLQELERAVTHRPRSAPIVRLAECYELLIAELRAERERSAELERQNDRLRVHADALRKLYAEHTGHDHWTPSPETMYAELRRRP